MSLAYKKWGTRLQKSEELTDRLERLSTKIAPNVLSATLEEGRKFVSGCCRHYCYYVEGDM